MNGSTVAGTLDHAFECARYHGMTTHKPDALAPSPEAQAHINRGISYFKEMGLTALKEPNLSRTQVADMGVAELQTALPTCSIETQAPIPL